MGFLDTKEDLLKIILTQHGRKRLSEGNLKVAHYAFLDDEIDYEVSSGVITGSVASEADSFVPTDLASLQRWWRPNVSMTGDPVTSWVDVVASKALAPGNAPAVGSIGGIPSPVFDGSADTLAESASTSLFKFLHDGTGGTIAMVVQRDPSAGNRAFLSTGDNSTSEVGTYIGSPGTTTVQVSITNGTAEVIGITSTGTPFSSADPVVIVVTYDSAAATHALLYINGTLDGSSNEAAVPSSGNSTNPFTVGSRVGSRFWLGPIGDILIFNEALTGQDLANIHDYLIGIYL